MRVLTWNLYHGRDAPPDPALSTCRSRLLRTTERNDTHVQVNRPLLDEFATWLEAHEWDVALLQEAPPRWFRALGGRTRASGVLALTSRNWLPALQRPLADWSPDLLASSEGGSNQTFVRHPGRVLEHRRVTLTRLPERRRMLWVRAELSGGHRVCAANLHASAGRPHKASAEVLAAAEAAVEWSAGDPLLFGGDFNLRPRSEPGPFAELRERFGLAEPAGPNAIDHLLVDGLGIAEPPRRLPAEAREVEQPDGRRLRMSDHAPVIARFEVR